jgi:hypothetical protein
MLRKEDHQLILSLRSKFHRDVVVLVDLQFKKVKSILQRILQRSLMLSVKEDTKVEKRNVVGLKETFSRHSEKVVS